MRVPRAPLATHGGAKQSGSRERRLAMLKRWGVSRDAVGDDEHGGDARRTTPDATDALHVGGGAAGELAGQPRSSSPRTWFDPESGGQRPASRRRRRGGVLDVQAMTTGACGNVSTPWARERARSKARDRLGAPLRPHAAATGQHGADLGGRSSGKRRGDAVLDARGGEERSVIELAQPAWTGGRSNARAGRRTGAVGGQRDPAPTDRRRGSRALSAPAAPKGATDRIVELPAGMSRRAAVRHTRRKGDSRRDQGAVAWGKVRGRQRPASRCRGASSRAARTRWRRNETMPRRAKRHTLKDRELIAHLSGSAR